MRTQSIYVIAHPDGIRKIGHAGNPNTRLHQIQRHSGSPLIGEYWFDIQTSDENWADQFKVARNLEQKTHELLNSKKLIGEWFKITSEEAVKSILEAARKNEISITEKPFPANRWIKSDTRCATDMDMRLLRAARCLTRTPYKTLAKLTGIDMYELQRMFLTTVNVDSIDSNSVKTIKKALEVEGIIFESNGITFSDDTCVCVEEKTNR